MTTLFTFTRKPKTRKQAARIKSRKIVREFENLLNPLPSDERESLRLWILAELDTFWTTKGAGKPVLLQAPIAR